MPIVFDGKASGVGGVLSTNQVVTFNHTIGYANTVLILVALDCVVGAGGAGGLQAATFNGVSFQGQIITYSNLGFNVEYWYYFNPPVGTYTVSLTWDQFTSADGYAFYTSSWLGLKRSFPLAGASGSTLDGTSSISVSATPKRGSSLILSAFADDATSSWTGPIGTSLFYDNGSQTYALNYQVTNNSKATVTDGFTSGTSGGTNYVGLMVEIPTPYQVASVPDPFMF